MGGFLSRIELISVRNLEYASIHPAPRINLLYGANGSGKSSFLEAIHLLGMGRSFRTPHIRQVIKEQKESAIVFAEYLSKEGISTTLGIKKGKDSTAIRINGQRVHALSELARRLPLQLISPDSSQLIEGGPRHRRQYMNWGMFHVEQKFFPVWRRFQHALNQRNAAIKRGLPDAELTVWDKEMVQYAHQITVFRKAYLTKLTPLVKEMAGKLLGCKELQLRFFAGWNQEKDYGEQLVSALNRDRERGYTHLGPHRADLFIMVDGVAAKERVSRGEQKVLAAALHLAQVELMTREDRQSCVVLIDDLPSELDRERRALLIGYLQGLDCQVFVTATDRGLLDETLCREMDAVFHVEHGTIKKVV